MLYFRNISISGAASVLLFNFFLISCSREGQAVENNTAAIPIAAMRTALIELVMHTL